jgi:hypothetical protein
MALTEELANRREQARKSIPQEKLEVMDRATEELEKSGIAKSCLKEGDTAPEFTLSNSSGASISLSDILKKGPVVLSFYRGGW